MRPTTRRNFILQTPKSIIIPLIALFCVTNHLIAMAQEPQVIEPFKNMGYQGPAVNPFEASLVEPITKFGSKIVQAIEGKDKQNFVLSPISIHAAVSMLTIGSSDRKDLLKALEVDEKTYAKMHDAYKNVSQTFELENKKARDAKTMANKDKSSNADSMFGAGAGKRYTALEFWTMLVSAGGLTLKDDYKKSIEDHYRTRIELVEPTNAIQKQKLADEVNKWGKEAGFDSNLLKPEDLDTDKETLQLMTAVQVQAFWLEQFHKDLKAEQTFYNFGLASQLVNKPQLSTSDVNVQHVRFVANETAELVKRFADSPTTKSNMSATIGELAKLNFRGIVIPLEGRVTFTILEPLGQSGAGNELAQLEHCLLDSESNLLGKTLELLDHYAAGVVVRRLRMPAFKFENDVGLKEPLKAIGLAGLFDGSAMLTEIANKPLKVLKAKQQAMIEADEYGLKAAAITRFQIVALSSFINPKPLDVDVRNPFLFVIRYNKLPIFMGHLVHL